MPKQVPEAELADILKAVASFPQPASLEEIAGKERIPAAFDEANNCKDPRWR